MTTYTRSANPFISGTKPRRFFLSRKERMNKEIMLNGVSKDHYPKWSASKYYKNSEYENFSPELKDLMEIAPWVLAILCAVIAVF